MFSLKGTISRNAHVDLNDSAHTKFAMTALGYYDDADAGLSPYPDDKLFKAIKGFQRRNQLEDDGVIKHDGPTQEKINLRLQEDQKSGNAFSDFLGNYKDMREVNVAGADKYFHCKANYEATKRGWDGFAAAAFISNMREAENLAIDPFRKGLLPVIKDIGQDQGANFHGRNAALSGRFSSSREACAIFRPKGLDEKY